MSLTGLSNWQSSCLCKPSARIHRGHHAQMLSPHNDCSPQCSKPAWIFQKHQRCHGVHPELPALSSSVAELWAEPRGPRHCLGSTQPEARVSVSLTKQRFSTHLHPLASSHTQQPGRQPGLPQVGQPSSGGTAMPLVINTDQAAGALLPPSPGPCSRIHLGSVRTGCLAGGSDLLVSHSLKHLRPGEQNEWVCHSTTELL